MARVTVIGAGLLGSGFVTNLLAKGEAVTVWNRSPEKLAPLVERGAVAAASPAEAVRGADRVHLVLSEDDAVEAVVAAFAGALGDGVFVIDHSTNAPARVAERHPRLRAQGVRYVHAPVFMSPANAREAGGLMLLAASAEEADALAPLLAPMTGRVWFVGERCDLAATLKLTGNGVLLSLVGVLGDLIAMGEAQGLSPEQVLSLFEVFKPGNSFGFFGSRAARKGAGPASFELQMARKDLRLMLEAAGGPDDLVILPAVAAAMDRALEEGHAHKDYSVYAWPRGRHGAPGQG
jgi:3-hydroxyisobutyrate dehydrogenase